MSWRLLIIVFNQEICTVQFIKHLLKTVKEDIVSMVTVLEPKQDQYKD